MSWDEPEVRPKRRWVGMAIGLLVFFGLVAGIVVIGEKLGRDFADDLLEGQIAGALGVPSGDGVTVDLGPGSLVVQAISGGLDAVKITADAVPVGAATADVTLTAMGVPLDPNGSVSTLAATVVLDEAALLALSAGLTDAPVTSVDLVDGSLVLATTTAAFGQELPATVTLVPSAGEGVVAFTVSAMTVNNEPVDVAAAQAGAYGPGATAAATPRSLCVAGLLPAALTLKSVTVEGDTLVLGLSGKHVSLSGGGLGTKGECAA